MELAGNGIVVEILQFLLHQEVLRATSVRLKIK